MKIKTTLAALALTSASSMGAITLTGESSTFAYQYEMDVIASTQDLDGAGSATDWFANTAGGVRIPTVSGGIASSSQSAAPPEVLFRTDFGGSIQRQSLLGGDFTIEVGLRTIGPAGSAGIFGFALDPGGAASSFRLNVDNGGVSLDGDANSAIATSANNDIFHAIRIAYEAGTDEYSAWRDGTLLYDAVTGTNPGFNNNGSFFIGDFTGTLGGEWEVDYIRLDANAVAPIPEPAGATLFGLGALTLLLRRRR